MKCLASMEMVPRERDRTTDTAIFSRMLYQLSYLGTSRASAGRAYPSICVSPQIEIA
jgi:hypothetical protein